MVTDFRDLDFVHDHWPHLLESRIRGTARPWREPTTSPETRAQADAAARAERLERSDVAPGEHPAPMHVDVLDVIVDLVITADDLAQRVAQAAGVDRPAPAAGAFADPRPHLRHIRAWWTAATIADDKLHAHAEHHLRRLAEDVALALRIVRDGQILQALCPWCGGRTEHQPTGGARTLRVHETPGGWLIVCNGVNCQPQEAECGKRWRGKPAWPDFEWVWLAQRLAPVAAA